MVAKSRAAGQTLGDFCSQLAAGTPAPGGGAASAAVGAMGAALAAMAAGLTIGRPQFEAVHAEMLALQRSAEREMDTLLICADRDQAGFTAVMAALELPRGSADRQQALEAGYKAATAAPLQTMQHSLRVMWHALAAAQRANPHALSDAYVGYLAASAAFEGGLWSAAMNLGQIADRLFYERVQEAIRTMQAERKELVRQFERLVPTVVRELVGDVPWRVGEVHGGSERS
jgi:formiminotetrahydrofolate cyclodeaminase